MLAHQIDCAAHLDCKRIICLASGPGPDLQATRAYAERAGIRFDIVDTIMRVTAAVTASDEVIVIADGVLPDCEGLVAVLTARAAVVAFPADPALQHGFERLDASRAWSGALRMRGDGVAHLADLPADCDLASSLLRIALQSGSPVVELDPACLHEGSWQRRLGRQINLDAERRWIARQVHLTPFIAPGLAVTERIALRWAQDTPGGRWSRAPHLAVPITGALALAVGLYATPLIGLGLLFWGYAAMVAAKTFDRVEMLGAPPRRADWRTPAAEWACDALLVGLIALLIAAEPWWLRPFLPLVLVASLLAATKLGPRRLQPLYRDRLALTAILLIGAWQGQVAAVVAAIAGLALGGVLWAAHRRNIEITAD